MCALIILTNGWCVTLLILLDVPVVDRFTRSVFVSYDWHIGEYTFRIQAAHHSKTITHGRTCRPCAFSRSTPELFSMLRSYCELQSHPSRHPLKTTAKPCFVILTLGYKLIYRTRMVRLDQMSFVQGFPPTVIKEERPRHGWRRIIGWIFFVE